jgi:hypothetical protein
MLKNALSFVPSCFLSKSNQSQWLAAPLPLGSTKFTEFGGSRVEAVDL